MHSGCPRGSTFRPSPRHRERAATGRLLPTAASSWSCPEGPRSGFFVNAGQTDGRDPRAAQDRLVLAFR